MAQVWQRGRAFRQRRIHGLPFILREWCRNTWLSASQGAGWTNDMIRHSGPNPHISPKPTPTPLDTHGCLVHSLQVSHPLPSTSRWRSQTMIYPTCSCQWHGQCARSNPAERDSRGLGQCHGRLVGDRKSPCALGGVPFFPPPWFSHLCDGNYGHACYLGLLARGVLLERAGAILVAAVSMGLVIFSLAFCATHKPQGFEIHS